MRVSLVTEGKSEHWIVKHLLETYFKGTEIFFRQVQPQIVDNTQESIGGWREVLKFCERTDDIKAALLEADYLVIQIDTDESANKQFGVSHTKVGNVAKTHEELYADIIQRIKEFIGDEVCIEHSHKIIFAVCIHTIECWLLPVYYTNKHRSDTRTCLTTLNTQLRKKNLPVIPPKKEAEKRKRAYESILSNWKSKRDIKLSATHNAGFRKFEESLKSVGTESL